MNVTSYRLKDLRMRNGYTKTDVARAVGVTRRAVYAWEHGTREPSTKNIVELALLYDVSTDYLLGLTNIENVENREEK